MEWSCLISCVAAVAGAWLGAFPIPLDWDRPWQVVLCTQVASLFIFCCFVVSSILLVRFCLASVFYAERTKLKASTEYVVLSCSLCFVRRYRDDAGITIEETPPSSP